MLEPFPRPSSTVGSWEGTGHSTHDLFVGWADPHQDPPPGRFLLEPERLRDGFRPASWMDEGPGHLRDLLLAHPNRDHSVGAPGPGLPVTGEQPPRGVPGEARGPDGFDRGGEGGAAVAR